MSEAALVAIRELIAQCTPEELAALFRELRARHLIHEFEEVIGAPAEMILEALHRAPELTRRMLRGVIADAAFRQFVVVPLAAAGWHDVTPVGNFAFDYQVDDGQGAMTVQVKLQRSERGAPVVKRGERYGFGDSVHIVETQKTRTGTDGEENQTGPYVTATSTFLRFRCSLQLASGTATGTPSGAGCCPGATQERWRHCSRWPSAPMTFGQTTSWRLSAGSGQRTVASE